jgi:hypothetical protein
VTAVTGEMNPAARLGIRDVGRPNNFSGWRCWPEADSAVLSRAIGGDVRVRRRTEIIAETQEQVVVRRAGREAVAWCVGCGKPARMLTLDKAMALTGASWEHFHSISSGRIAELPARHHLFTDCLILCCSAPASAASWRTVAPLGDAKPSTVGVMI